MDAIVLSVVMDNVAGGKKLRGGFAGLLCTLILRSVIIYKGTKLWSGSQGIAGMVNMARYTVTDVS